MPDAGQRSSAWLAGRRLSAEDVGVGTDRVPTFHPPSPINITPADLWTAISGGGGGGALITLRDGSTITLRDGSEVTLRSS